MPARRQKRLSSPTVARGLLLSTQKAAAVGPNLPEVSGRSDSQPTSPDSGREAEAVTALPALVSTAYEIQEKLGAGGMGTVFKAWDPVLRRHLALKFLHQDEPEQERRLLKEARAQAGVAHDNICRVYEVGRAERGFFIAMQLIAGQTLKSCVSQMALEQKVECFKQVADAVEAAHRLGVIHRDLKPSNILVERRDDGSWKPYVTDFGLAREVGLAGSTLAGTTLGTPQYMSPEQARGEIGALDGRSDVYSLGATFYEMLTGRPPFAGGSQLQILYRVVHELPAPPRKLVPGLPQGLEAVTLKCLEKAPARRYQSASALSADLGRFLRGEPVEARPPGALQKAQGLLARHPVLAGALSAALVAALIAGGFWRRELRRASEREALAQQFGQRVAESQNLLRVAAMMPLHDTSGERAQVRALISEIEREQQAEGRDPSPLVLSALGRSHLVLDDYAEARALLQRAWDVGERSAATAGALGEALGAAYKAGLAELSPSSTPRSKKRLELELRDPAVALLQRASDARTSAPEYAQARIDFYQQRYGDALRGCEASLLRLPWLYEARQLQGDVHVALGNARAQAGDEPAAFAEYRLAAEALQRAMDEARSDWRPAVAGCGVSAQILKLRAHGKLVPVEATVREAELLCGRAAQIAPDRAEPALVLADAYINAGAALNRSGVAPRELLEKGIAQARRAAAIAPRLARPLQQVGFGFALLGSYAASLGQPADKDLRTALASLAKARELDPNWTPTYQALGNAWVNLAFVQAESGGEPKEAHAAGIEAVKAGLALEPHSPALLALLGMLHSAQARWLARHGRDAQQAFEAGEAALAEAFELQRSPIDIEALAATWLEHADYDQTRGRDPLPALARAESAAEQCVALEPRSAAAHHRLGSLLLRRARLARSAGGDPRAWLLRAERETDEAQRLAPREPAFPSDAARSSIEAARYELQQGRSPDAARKAGLLLLDKSLALDPKRSPAHRRSAVLHLLSARYAAAHGADPLALLGQAEASARRASERNPSDGEALCLLAETLRNRAAWRSSHGQDASEDIEQGLAAAARALQADPSAADPLYERGRLLLLRDPKSREGRDAVAAALKSDPDLARNQEPG